MKSHIKYTLLAILAIIVITSCEEDYLTDGGISKATTELTTYDYLAQNKYHMFDTLLAIIDTLDLKESVNTCGTFFAPSDYNIQNYLDQVEDSLKDIDEELTYTLDDLYKDVTPKDLLQYMLNEKVTMSSTASSDGYTTLAETTITVKTVLQTDDQYYIYSESPVYFLFIGKEGKTDERCQTEGILTQSGEGTVLHVLNNDHVFISFEEDKNE